MKPDGQEQAFCWCHARWGLSAAAAHKDGTCGTCHGRSPGACERAHSREAQGLPVAAAPAALPGMEEK